MTDNELRKYFERQVGEQLNKDEFTGRVMNKLPKKKQNRSRNVILIFLGLAALLVSALFGFTLSDLIISMPEGIRQCSLPMIVIIVSWGLFGLLVQQAMQVLSEE